MRAYCVVGGCNWGITDGSVVDLEAFAEVHRATNHDWVKRGRCHRVELEPAEVEAVDAKLALWEELQASAASSKSKIYRGRDGTLRQI